MYGLVLRLGGLAKCGREAAPSSAAAGVCRARVRSWICSSHQQASHVGCRFVVAETLHAAVENVPQ